METLTRKRRDLILYLSGISQVVRVRDVKQLQDTENDPIIHDEMVNLGNMVKF